MASSRERDPKRGVYVISVAAELAGVHPQTLRLYERRGLLYPERTAGGARRYSDHDIDRLHRITELADAGLNIAGIEVALSLQQETARLRQEITDLRSAQEQKGAGAATTGAARPGEEGGGHARALD